ncbi:hypothetical protein GLAREA_12836 [Glarea lozoyensis ATCC 20868]|uniref:Uncharacterized protein n=1 Tax=Glarea lozoyensis (strain ATCC 20868 / MF5171) TaxID=1116229 RepID=S3DUK9_GLAL2|nr:uncharacterized protein GLAREA_12836 [Glarea lozoyensis ATCC 20868]EPE30113.1 hypothetical protein GLAREA_12836 [Glarea lozoyensis ATCC 20868]
MRVLIVLAAVAELSLAAVYPRQTISPSLVTSTYASTITNAVTRTTAVPVTSTTCVADTKIPSGLVCTNAVYSLTGGNYYSQQCSASLVGGVNIRAYVEPVGAGKSFSFRMFKELPLMFYSCHQYLCFLLQCAKQP